MNEIKLKTQSGREMNFIRGGVSSANRHETSLIIIMHGEDFTGKSRFGATGPETSAYIPLDRKTRFSAINCAMELGRDILLPQVDFVREGNMTVRGGWKAEEVEVDEKKAAEMDKATRIAYRAHVNQIKNAAWSLHDRSDVKLIQIDLFEQFCQDMVFAHYGRTGHKILKIARTDKIYKDTSEAHQEIVDFINSISDKHLILTHRTKDEYYNDVKTGRMTWSGNKFLGHSANVVVEMVKNRRYVAGDNDDKKSWHYGLTVQKCLHNIELEGEAGQLMLKDEMISFPMLAMAVFPGSELGDWE